MIRRRKYYQFLPLFARKARAPGLTRYGGSVYFGVSDPHALQAQRKHMAKFTIAPHMRLHEWVAEEKGYFAAEGLDYEFHEALSSKEAQHHQLGDKIGAFQT